MKNKKVCVIGLGYIGLPTAALLANRGYDVHGIDINKNVIDTINSGRIHIVEVGLDAFVHSAVQSGHLKAGAKPTEADIFIIAVPTPFHPHQEGEIPKPNIDYVVSATKAIAPFVREGNIVILESTSPVGTTDKVVEILKETRPELFHLDNSKLYISHCPERVLPGRIMIELVENDRIVGGIDDASTNKTVEFYQTFVEGEILKTDAKTAEMAKLTENSFRDVNIAFANELSMICDVLDIDVEVLMKLANHHPRVNILTPGCGVGGHCIAVDPWFIVDSVPELAKIIRAGREVNDFKSQWVIEKIKSEYRKIKHHKPIVTVLGLAFKPDIDDLRCSPAVKVVKALLCEKDAEFLVVEPNIEEHDDFLLTAYYDAIHKADVIACLVGHREFKGLSDRNSDSVVLNFCGLLIDKNIGRKFL